MTLDTVQRTELKVAALEGMKALAGNSPEDPQTVGPIANWIERRYRYVGPYTIEDVYEVLKEAETEGLTRYVEVGHYSGFALTEQGLS